MRKTNADGIKTIKFFEGCKLKAYKCPAGVWTIGWGSTGKEIVEGLTWTQEQADERLLKDLESFEKGVEKYVKVPVTDNEFSALVCFSYNVGLGNLKSSTLLKKLNANDKAGAAEQFLVWNKAGGKVLNGLIVRRKAERELFLKA